MNTSTKHTAKSVPSITWSTPDASRRPRWWVFAIVGYTTPLAVLSVLAAGNWSASLALAASGVTFFVVYLPRPKVWRFRLARSVLTARRENRRGPADELTVTLSDYRAATERIVANAADPAARTVLTLLPVKRFDRELDVPMPTDTATANQIKTTITDALARVPSELRN